MSGRLKEIPEETQWMLRLASCIGSEFDLRTLATLSHRTQPETATSLGHALASGLILPLTQNYIFAEQVEIETDVRYSFAHAGIQQGIYAGIPQEEKQSHHWQLGQLLLAEIPDDQRERRIFDLVRQLNLGSGLIQSDEQRLLLANLNLMASQKTYFSAAHHTSHQYAHQGLRYLHDLEEPGNNVWKDHYPLAFDLYTRAASASYLTGRFDEMERWSDTLIANAASVYDQAGVYEMKLYASISKDDRAEGLKMGLKALSLLGLNYPKKPGIPHVLGKLIQCRLSLRGKSDDDLVNLPITDDQRIIAIGRVIRAFFTILYTNAPELAPLVFMDLVILSLKHGNFSMSPFGYICFGFILSSALGDLGGGDRFGRLAMRLVEKLNMPQAKAIAYFFHATVLQHWTEPLRNTIPLLDEGIAAALSVGDFTNASTMLLIRDYHDYCTGRRLLEDVDRDMTATDAVLNQFQQGSVINYHRLWHQAALNMMGRGNDRSTLKGPLSDSETGLPQHIAANERSIVMNYYLQPTIFHYLYEDVQDCAGIRRKDEGLPGWRHWRPYNAHLPYVSILSIHLGLWGELSPGERRKAGRRIAGNQKKLKKWAKFAPENALHKAVLVDAELARVRGRSRAGA